jgi:hypothetical protein
MLLQPEYGMVPFEDGKQNWRNSKLADRRRTLSPLVATGTGGSGKTRLISEWLTKLVGAAG